MDNIQAVRPNQRDISSSYSLPNASSNTLPCILKRLAASGGAWGHPGPYTGYQLICGHVHLTMVVSSCLMRTSGGPQVIQPHCKASTNTLSYVLKLLAAFGGTWGPPRVPYTGYDLACGHVHLTMDVSSYLRWTSRGP